MSRFALALVAAMALMLASIGTAIAHHKDDHDQGPPNDPPCEQGNAGENNPNCDPDRDPDDGKKDRDRDRDKDRDRDRDRDRDKDKNGNGEPEPCPEGLELDLGPLAYICLYLLPDEPIDPDEADCPDGAIPLELPLEPVVWACVIVLPDDNGDDVDDVNGVDDPVNGAFQTLGL